MRNTRGRRGGRVQGQWCRPSIRLAGETERGGPVDSMEGERRRRGSDGEGWRRMERDGHHIALHPLRNLVEWRHGGREQKRERLSSFFVFLSLRFSVQINHCPHFHFFHTLPSTHLPFQPRPMASNLTVNLGGGKKQLVKTTPTMILRQVVNSVCEKQDYAEPETYGLKYVPIVQWHLALCTSPDMSSAEGACICMRIALVLCCVVVFVMLTMPGMQRADPFSWGGIKAWSGPNFFVLIINHVCFLPFISLRSGKNFLDLSLSIRYANIAPGAKLELARVPKDRSGKETPTDLKGTMATRLVFFFGKRRHDGL